MCSDATQITYLLTWSRQEPAIGGPVTKTPPGRILARLDQVSKSVSKKERL
jgi:hypothetical protein